MARVFIVAALVFVCCAAGATAQSDSFVTQLSVAGGASVTQSGSSSGAFVQQVPEDAKLSPPASVPAKPSYVKMEFILPKVSADAVEETVVVYEDEGLVAYGEDARPALPVIGQGVTVVLNAPSAASAFPTIGAGAVLL